jgi:hypothetical protein
VFAAVQRYTYASTPSNAQRISPKVPVSPALVGAVFNAAKSICPVTFIPFAVVVSLSSPALEYKVIEVASEESFKSPDILSSKVDAVGNPIEVVVSVEFKTREGIFKLFDPSTEKGESPIASAAVKTGKKSNVPEPVIVPVAAGTVFMISCIV